MKLLKSEFCQSSRDGLCRLDALCNAIGSNFIGLKRFNEKCDEYDAKHGFQIGFSRELFSIAGDEYDNIFNHILTETGKYYTNYVGKSSFIPNDLDCVSVIIFSETHTWALRRCKHDKDMWLEFDKTVKVVQPNRVYNFIGAILIYSLSEEVSGKNKLSRTQQKKLKRAERKLKQKQLKY